MYMYSSLEQHPQVPPNCRLIETMLDDQWELGVTNSSRGAVDFLHPKLTTCSLPLTTSGYQCTQCQLGVLQVAS